MTILHQLIYTHIYYIWHVADSIQVLQIMYEYVCMYLFMRLYIYNLKSKQMFNTHINGVSAFIHGIKIMMRYVHAHEFHANY